MNSAIIIPALNPKTELLDLLKGLLALGAPQIIVVNDGSGQEYDDIFEKVSVLPKCVLLKHAVNMGKGRALKTAFAYYLDNCSHLDGVVTADADGQHSVEDISRIAYALNNNRDKLVLGVRNFEKDKVPRRSYMGNTITSLCFKLFYGYYLKDTQTGLRGIPTSELGWMLELSGERYDFEINMLIKARRRKLDFLEIGIDTIYFDNNAGSHYGSFKDSARIFCKLIGGLIHYSLSCSFSALVDVMAFIILNKQAAFSNNHCKNNIVFIQFFHKFTNSIC
jgi:glycosyltransferase involved in cell wall biosynthesis